MKYLNILLFLILLVVPKTISAQYYDTGQDPAKLKWLHISTDRFKIIYPENYGLQGIEFARELDKSFSKLTTLFPEKKFRIPVIIHNYTTQANGYVIWAPKRMEIYPTPDQNGIPSATNEQLTLHELAHVMQVASLNSGFSKMMSFATGEQFMGLVAGLLVPMWYLEGSAVFSETVLSESGRGRRPDFQKELKALVIENDHIYKYDKLLNGSYRYYTPDHYQFGYQMVAWSNAKYDLQLWNKVMDFTGREPFTLNPFNISLRRNAGLTKNSLFRETFDSLKTLWKEDLAQSAAIKYTALNPSRKKGYVSYSSPLIAGEDSIIAYRYSMSNPDAIVLIRPSEKSVNRLHVPGYINDKYLSYAKGRLVWVEFKPDPRWENRNYSVIIMKDLKSGQTRQLSWKSRFMSASISPDGRMIAASENSIENKNNLVVINSSDGSVLMTIPVPGNASIQRPIWSADGRKITVIYLTDEGEGIMSCSPDTRVWKVLIEPGRNDIQSSFLRNDSLFFTSSASGTDNIYILSPDNKVAGITRSRFGASDLNVSGSSIAFADYTSEGSDICLISVSTAKPVEQQSVKPVSFLAGRFDLDRQEKENVSLKEYTPERYRKWKHLFGFHSWMPFYPDILALSDDPSSIRPGLTLLTQNQLSTLISTVGYEYSEDHRHKFHSQIMWEGWYPKFISEFDYNNQPVINKMNETVSWTPSTVHPGLSFKNTVYVPLDFSSGRFSQYLRPSFSSEYLNNYLYIKNKNVYDYGQTQLTGRLYFSNYHRSAYRDIYNRWAQTLDLSYTFAPLDNEFYGNDLFLMTSFYFPGIFRNNSIRFRFDTEKQEFEKFLTFNRIHFPRGYSRTSGWYLDDKEIVSVISGRLAFYSLDYTAPLVYPDLNISSLLYLTRIRGGLFYDYARGTDNYHLKLKDGRMVTDTRNTGSDVFSSFGVELLSDFYLFRIPFRFSAGGRAAWKTINRSPALEFLFNIDIYGMKIGRNRF
jgi:hypothetical protein